jgi:hypothetical protein
VIIVIIVKTGVACTPQYVQSMIRSLEEEVCQELKRLEILKAWLERLTMLEVHGMILLSVVELAIWVEMLPV